MLLKKTTTQTASKNMKKHKSVDKNNSIGNEYHTQCVMHNTKFVQKLAFTYGNCTDEILRYTTTTQA